MTSQMAMQLLRTRLNRLKAARWQQFVGELAALYRFIDREPSFRAIIQAAKTNRGVDPDRWLADEVMGRERGEWVWPPEDDEKFRVVWRLIERWVNVASQEDDAFSWAFQMSLASNGCTEQAEFLIEHVVEPALEYLVERLGTSSEVLYLLARYCKSVEWFEQESLYQRYKETTETGENIYDADLRRYLMDQGIDYPFSQPGSASGRADVVGLLNTEDPLICEIKLYDGGKSKNISYLSAGLNQAVKYASDYHKPVAYLVVVNLSPRQLELPNDEPGEWPPRLCVANITVYLIQVSARPLPTASKQGKFLLKAITREQLVTYDPEHDVADEPHIEERA